MKQDQEPLIFPRIIEKCKEIFPEVHWEIQELEKSPSWYIYKLIGEAKGIRTFEQIEPIQGADKILADAGHCAYVIVDRIKRLSVK